MVTNSRNSFMRYDSWKGRLPKSSMAQMAKPNQNMPSRPICMYTNMYRFIVPKISHSFSL